MRHTGIRNTPERFKARVAADPRFATNPERVRNRDTLIPILRTLISGCAMDDWIASLNAASVPVGLINDIERVFSDPHVQACGMQTRPMASIRTIKNLTTRGYMYPLNHINRTHSD